MKPQLIDAILSLVPDAEVSVTGDHVTWLLPRVAPVSEETIAQELKRLTAEHEQNDYKRKRAAEYPPITDYVDGVVKGDQGQIEAYISTCLAVKAKYPKPTDA